MAGNAHRTRIFLSRWFLRFDRKTGIKDADLCKAIRLAELGLIHANLGGSVIKQRIPRPNKGKSGGIRSIVLFQAGNKAFFVYGFLKNERDNLRVDEVNGFKTLAEEMFVYDSDTLANALTRGFIVEVKCNE